MKENTVERFIIEKVSRKDIHGAPYNPRIISKSAMDKLRKDLRDIGLLTPIVVNRRTMSIVSGHQRIEAMDTILKTDDYELTVAMVDLDNDQEVKANILMNNQSVMGEWDTNKLAEIKLSIPEIDFVVDLGFEKADLDIMFIDDPSFGDIVSPELKIVKTESEHMADVQKFKDAKKSQREKIQAQESETGETWAVEKDNYTLMIVFNTNAEKKYFIDKASKIIKSLLQNDRVVSASIFDDIASGKIKLIG